MKAVRTIHTPVHLEVMSSIPRENCSGVAEIVKSYDDGTVQLHLLGTKRHYFAWFRPGGDETDFVCGALAPGRPAAHPNSTECSPQDQPTAKDVA